MRDQHDRESITKEKSVQGTPFGNKIVDATLEHHPNVNIELQ